MAKRPTAPLARATRLRKEATKWERLLWPRLREMKTLGFHFRRQAVIGPYIADFACLSRKLLVELDGEHHAAPALLTHDTAREFFLRRLGFRIMRFRNSDVIENLDAVATAIREALNDKCG
ncbi:MAG TPA: endonuclease domain-containing protein [Micropepsaceae bacterium]|nr:endonuclease domain-containing protein [Micropepsaceae bacterium]